MEFADKILSQYGFGVFMAIVMVAFFYFLLKWVMSQQDKLQNQANDRERSLFGIIEGHKESLNIHSQQSQAFHEEMKKAFNFNREEHIEMMKTLGRINGYRKE